MSTNSQNNDNQEIDLSEISKKIGGLYNAVLRSIFNLILFFSGSSSAYDFVFDFQYFDASIQTIFLCSREVHQSDVSFEKRGL